MSSSSTVLVTGAGSGVGRACALKLAAEGWSVALLGRSIHPLNATLALATQSSSPQVATFPCDIGEPAAVAAVAKSMLKTFGRIDALVNAAGTNIARRSLDALTSADFQATLATNLYGAFNCAQAVLPAMRRQGGGTIININSEAGLKANTKSGAAYIASKFGLAGLTQTINAEERSRGIRACSIFPGDINTPLLDKRPVPPGRKARARMLQPDDVAACVWLALSLPARAVVEELLVRPL